VVTTASSQVFSCAFFTRLSINVTEKDAVMDISISFFQNAISELELLLEADCFVMLKKSFRGLFISSQQHREKDVQTGTSQGAISSPNYKELRQKVNQAFDV